MDDDYETVKRRFEEALLKHGDALPYRDDAFIADAVLVFCLEYMRESQPDTLQAKAARPIVQRLMAMPDLQKQWRVSFPYPFVAKSNLTPAQKAGRLLAFEVTKRVEDGEMVTHAIAAVAVDRHCSPEKVRGYYYEWREYFERLLDRRSSS